MRLEIKIMRLKKSRLWDLVRIMWLHDIEILNYEMESQMSWAEKIKIMRYMVKIMKC